ncbi:hypothetical protein [Streptomyces sp. XY533]|uniref:hypothetical protein n=1 Tax=Streptomyces sp. XY533 TaxID=1519481 RepID=UPI0006B048DC|nr:hypothetical protein [Streptomyces sp. XY533]KOU99114.1 hypothetical protein ADK92_13000 [Streptomyces sp. XY533]
MSTARVLEDAGCTVCGCGLPGDGLRRAGRYRPRAGGRGRSPGADLHLLLLALLVVEMEARQSV